MFSATSDCDSVFIPQEMPSLLYGYFFQAEGVTLYGRGLQWSQINHTFSF
jgi:hypothetical protein